MYWFGHSNKIKRSQIVFQEGPGIPGKCDWAIQSAHNSAAADFSPETASSHNQLNHLKKKEIESTIWGTTSSHSRLMLIKLWWMEGRLKAGSVSRGKLFISSEFFLSFGFLQTRLIWLSLSCVGLFLSLVELFLAGFHLLVKLFDDDVSTWSPRVIAFCSVSTRCCRGLQRLGIDLLIGPLFPHDFSRYENSLVRLFVALERDCPAPTALWIWVPLLTCSIPSSLPLRTEETDFDLDPPSISCLPELLHCLLSSCIACWQIDLEPAP